MTEDLNLLPCPFCGGEASFGRIDDLDNRDFGGNFISCDTLTCEASTNLIFACGDDPKPLLADKWNRRPAHAPGDHFAGGGKPISDGFAIVPVRPTTAMLDVAVSFALMVKLSSGYNWTQYMTDVWARMVGAAMAQEDNQP